MYKKTYNLKRLLAIKGISQSDLAKMAGKTPQWASFMVHHSPTLKSIEYIASLLNVQVSELFEEPLAENGKIECPHCGNHIKIIKDE